MNETKLHRPIWHTPSSGGSKSPSFCRSCGIRRGLPASHPVHYAERDEGGWGWNLICTRYGEATATGLSFASADKLAKANNDGSEPCGCEPQPSEDEVLTAALAVLEAGDPQPVLDAAASGILPTDAPVVAQAWDLAASKPIHCGACRSHPFHSKPMPGCHRCASTAPFEPKPVEPLCDDCGLPYPGPAYYSFDDDGSGNLCPACAGPHLEPDTDGDPRRPEETPATQTTETNATISESLAGTISLRPSDEGFMRIAERFATSILMDLPQRRREDSRHLLDSMIEIVAYLAQTDPKLVQQLRDEVTRRTR